MSRAVIDASVLAAAWLPSQHLTEAEHLLQSITSLYAPELIRLEFYNTVHRLSRRGSLTMDEADQRLTKFEQLSASILQDSSWLPRATRVARRYNHRHVYDAIYLACAEDLDAELWTCDARFVR
ncbi:MAG: type II toxin-antitoxin system VapC family toxin, partial [Dehalococcoidia bacterium]